jgi:hypothetical protein
MIQDVKTGDAYWLRVTSLIPKDPKEKDTVLLWFGYFSSTNSSKSFMVKRSFPLSDFTFGLDESIVAFSGGTLGITQSKIEFYLSDGSQYGWDLRFSALKKPYQHVPSLAKTLNIVTTVPVTIHPCIQINGTVTINGKLKEINNAAGTQTHIIGKKYSSPWAWAHCNTFEGLHDAYLEVSCIRGKCTFGFTDGKNEYMFNSPLAVVQTKYNSSLISLEFSGEDLNHIVKGKITVPKEDIVAIEYAGPTNERILCYNSELASCKIEIFEKKLLKVDKSPILTAISNRAIAFETTHFTPPDDSPKYLPWEKEKL